MNQQLNNVYNVGDSLTIPITIKSNSVASGSIYMNLICGGISKQFYQNNYKFSAGEEKIFESTLVLDKKLIGEMKGTCLIKGSFAHEYALSNEFKISDKIVIKTEITQMEFNPGENVLVQGTAMRENGQGANGFIYLKISIDSSNSITQLETLTNGYFSINVNLPENMKAGKYLLELNAYEKDYEDTKINSGFANSNIQIRQIPRSLEVVFENKEVEPGTNVKVKAVMHDQTGESISGLTAIITVKDENNKIMEQTEKSTDEFLEVSIAYDQNPAEWTAVAVSTQMNAESTFKILEKKAVNVKMEDDIITIANIGNVIYDDVVLIKVGEESINLPVYLEVGETQKYKVTAPNGEYEIKVIKGGEQLSQKAVLTGKVIDVKEFQEKNLRFWLPWIFLILVLIVVAYLLIKRNRKRAFYGFASTKHSKVPTRKFHDVPMSSPMSSEIFLKKNNERLKSRNPAEVSLSIKGERQDATAVCVHVRNMGEIATQKGTGDENLQKIIDFGEDRKAMTYQDKSDIFLILAPSKTKTFSNEKTALTIAQNARNILTGYNKLFNPKMDFGISINNGVMVIRPEPGVTKFMSMGTFITSTRKMASMSHEEILIGDEAKKKVYSDIKGERLKEKENVYVIKEIKKENEEHKKFIDSFMKRSKI